MTEDLKNSERDNQISKMSTKIKEWENNAGEDFTDYFMHDNVNDKSWAFWLLGKGFEEHANIIISEILSGNTCIDQDVLYEIYSEDCEVFEECYGNYDKNVLLWSEFLTATPLYKKRINKFFDEQGN